MAHPRANIQVERANDMLLDDLRMRLYEVSNIRGGKWIKELPYVLWGLCTQPTKPMGRSPYYLVYGSEAILPADLIGTPPAIDQYKEGVAEETRRLDVDFLEEACCATLITSARYVDGLHRYHDRNVKERAFSMRDMIL